MRVQFGEYEEGILKMRPPQAWWDTKRLQNSTILTVDSANREGSLLEIVQLLDDLDLIFHKATISSDGHWLLDVFHIADHLGRKVTDERLLQYINVVLRKEPAEVESAGVDLRTSLGRPVKRMDSLSRLTAIELIGNDHPGLLSECAGILAHNAYCVVAAALWTHAGRVVSIIYVKDEKDFTKEESDARQNHVSSLLRDILQGEVKTKTKATVGFTTGMKQPERRLHQMLYADRDYDANPYDVELPLDGRIPSIGVRYCPDTNYSVIYIKSADRPKLLFDSLCTLTDMRYNVYHASIDTCRGIADQEYYVKDMDGGLLDTEAERIKVTKCLFAAIDRRTPQGVCLVLRDEDKAGLLARVTMVFRIHELSITKAEIDTLDGQAINVFYVTAADKSYPRPEVIEAVLAEVGPSLQVREPERPPALTGWPLVTQRTMAVIRSAQALLQGIGLRL